MDDTYRKLTVLPAHQVKDLLTASDALASLSNLIVAVDKDKYMSSHSPADQQDLAVAEMILAGLMQNVVSDITRISVRRPSRAEEVAWALGQLSASSIGSDKDIANVRSTLHLERTEGWIGETAKAELLKNANTQFMHEGVSAS